MNFENKAFLLCVTLFVGLVLMTELGRRLGRWLRGRAGQDMPGLGAVEGAIFALLGLMIAFTFQGAASRFEDRRTLVVQEANDIGTAWLRVDLLPSTEQPPVRALFRQYLDSRLQTYRLIPDMAAVKAEQGRTAQLQGEIWKRAVASSDAGGPKVTTTFLPALNAMFDTATSRTMAAEKHPPRIVFLMLTFLAAAAALFAGYGMSGGPTRSWIHILGFASVLAITVFVIVDMEFPRVGFIRIDTFDHVLIDLRASMD